MPRRSSRSRRSSTPIFFFENVNSIKRLFRKRTSRQGNHENVQVPLVSPESIVADASSNGSSSRRSRNNGGSLELDSVQISPDDSHSVVSSLQNGAAISIIFWEEINRIESIIPPPENIDVVVSGADTASVIEDEDFIHSHQEPDTVATECSMLLPSHNDHFSSGQIEAGMRTVANIPGFDTESQSDEFSAGPLLSSEGDPKLLQDDSNSNAETIQPDDSSLASSHIDLCSKQMMGTRKYFLESQVDACSCSIESPSSGGESNSESNITQADKLTQCLSHASEVETTSESRFDAFCDNPPSAWEGIDLYQHALNSKSNAMQQVDSILNSSHDVALGEMMEGTNELKDLSPLDRENLECQADVTRAGPLSVSKGDDSSHSDSGCETVLLDDSTAYSADDDVSSMQVVVNRREAEDTSVGATNVTQESTNSESESESKKSTPYSFLDDASSIQRVVDASGVEVLGSSTENSDHFNMPDISDSENNSIVNDPAHSSIPTVNAAQARVRTENEENKDPTAEVFGWNDVVDIASVAKRNGLGGDAMFCREANSQFRAGDEVKVVEKHPKYGMVGIVEKQTACFVFLKDASSNEIVRIKPKFLERISIRNCPAIVKNSERFCRSNQLSPSQESPVSSEGQTQFSVGCRVKVRQNHAKHKGKVGIVNRFTAKFVLVMLDDNPTKEEKVMPKFLERLACENLHLYVSPGPDNGENGLENSTKANFQPLERTQRGQLFDRPKLNTGHVDDQSVDSTFNLEGWKVPPSSEESRLALGDMFIERIRCHSEGKSPEINCLFKWRWEGRYLIIEIPISRVRTERKNLPIRLSTTCSPGIFEIYHADIDEENSLFGFNKSKKVVAYYAQTEGPNIDHVDFREFEELLGDFGTLTPRKVLARRKLALSPAIKIGKEYAMFNIALNEIEMIEDIGTAGCGFIDETYLEKLFGGKAAARRTLLAIQIRIFVPGKGIFKGMLMRKRFISGGLIQLNESLLTVPPSRKNCDIDNGCIVITKQFPSANNLQVGRLFQPHGKDVTKSFRKELKAGRACKLSDMITRLWKGLHVPDDVIKDYAVSSKAPEGLCHTYVVGVSDPTNELPPDWVYVTGAQPLDVKEFFVTRSPCLEAKDGRMVQVVTTKPDMMSDDSWTWLQSLPFGAIIFGNPRPGNRPLPEIIASGDLDGDLYFICWNKKVLSHIKPIPISNEELMAPNDAPEKQKMRPYDTDWFENAQEYASRILERVDLHSLIGCLYNEAKAIADKSESFIEDPDYVCFAQAYKQALELEKWVPVQ